VNKKPAFRMSAIGKVWAQAIAACTLLLGSSMALAWDTVPPPGGYHPELMSDAVCKHDANNYYTGSGHRYLGMLNGMTEIEARRWEIGARASQQGQVVRPLSGQQ